jgi:transposase
MTKKSNVPVFKDYTMGQIVLLPVDLEEEIEPEHLVRVVNAAIEEMNLSQVYAQYAGGGTSSYHPKMLLKVLIYAYSQQIYSSRKIAKALRENIYFMWLSGNNHPDFHTINRFRGVVVKATIGEIFAGVLRILVDGGYVKLENYFVDGTKLEANANKYSFVWAKNTQRYTDQVQTKVAQLLEEIEQINAAEDAEYGSSDLPERGGTKKLDAAQLKQRIQELNERLGQMAQAEEPQADPTVPGPTPEQSQPAAEQSQGPSDPETNPRSKKHSARSEPQSKAASLAERIQKLGEEYLPRLQQYEAQAALLGGRNSYSKTDPEATFMRMKDDAMKNGQLKAGYNIQIGTEKQFVLNFSVHQRPGDPGCLIPHLEQLKQRLGRLPDNIVADSAYGSEENYVYLEQEQVGNYLKYNTFYQEHRARFKPKPFDANFWPYDADQDKFTCPNGQELTYQTTRHERTENGFETERRVYECADCSACPLKPKCTQAAGNRQIRVSFRLRAQRAQAAENLCSEKGKQLRAQRSTDVETVFGRIKQDWGFRRFLLRGLEKVNAEWGLICIAHNFAKMAVA